MIFCLRRLAPKLRVAGTRYFRNSAPSAGLGMKTTLKPRLGPQDSNSPTVISPPAEQTCSTVDATAHLGTYVAPVEGNGEVDRGQLHNPYQGIPTAWQVAYESCFLPCSSTPLIVEQPLTAEPAQLGEPIDQFLARCIPSQTETIVGPWIWIANPRAKRQNNKSFDPAEALLREPLEKAQQDWANIIADSSLNRVRLASLLPLPPNRSLCFFPSFFPFLAAHGC